MKQFLFLESRREFEYYNVSTFILEKIYSVQVQVQSSLECKKKCCQSQYNNINKSIGLLKPFRQQWLGLGVKGNSPTKKHTNYYLSND